MKKLILLFAVAATLFSCGGASAPVGLEPGNQAPDFTLKSIDGTDVALSSLKGKVTVLDFWGSWCIWCIRGVPDMKASYAKYSPDLQIVGIACRDTDEDWRAAVAEYELPWIHLFNGEGDADVSALYAIEGYPTKVILDKDLKVVEVFIGEVPEFYEKLDELMGQ